MHPLRVIAIPTPVADEVRRSSRSPFADHPTHTEVAAGHGPCRHCLRTFHVGEERRILFTYDSFSPLGAPPLPGPVFIHEAPCARYSEDGGTPRDLDGRTLTLNAYGRPRKLLVQGECRGDELEDAAQRLFTRAAVDFIHVRDTEAGCYDFRLERAGAG